MKHRQHSQKDANAPGAQGGFRLPPEVSFSKQPLSDATAYVFRHRSLGELGRIVMQETGDGGAHLPSKWWAALPILGLLSVLRSFNPWEWNWRARRKP